MNVTEFLTAVKATITACEDSKTRMHRQTERTAAEAVAYDSIKAYFNEFRDTVNKNSDIL